MVDKEKRNLTAWVPGKFYDRVKAYIDKENAKPESLGIKMKIREFIIKACEFYLNKNGG